MKSILSNVNGESYVEFFGEKSIVMRSLHSGSFEATMRKKRIVSVIVNKGYISEEI